jgi:hypothetical protein
MFILITCNHSSVMDSKSGSTSFFSTLTSAQAVQEILSNEWNPRVTLSPTKAPKVIWNNPRLRLIPENATGDEASSFLSKLAQRIGLKIETISEQASEEGIVDRYGGRGLGRNGGSGRSVFVGDTYLKGVGRTPLLGRSTDSAHASGGAYLEECAREILFSEIVSAEFPFGCVPTSAVCLTGDFSVWRTLSGDKNEHKCILARPLFIRPSHFEKAAGFDPLNLNEFSMDEARVASSIHQLKDLINDDDQLQAGISIFWLRWAEQIAYGFAHRMSCGGLSTSNITIDARWVDFGAWASLPSWGRYALDPRVESFGLELSALFECMKAFYNVLATHGILEANQGSVIDKVFQTCILRYERRVAFELLRVFGLTRKQSLAILEGPRTAEIMKTLSSFLAQFQREHLSIIYETELPRVAWCPEAFWREGKKKAHSLAGILGDELGLFGTSSDSKDSLSHLLERARFIGRPRISLYRDQLKSNLYNKLELDLSPESLSPESFGSIINTMICEGRRDCSFDFDEGVPIGFARSSMFAMVIFFYWKESTYIGVVEWSLIRNYPRGFKFDLGNKLDNAFTSLKNEHGEFSFCLAPWV